MDDNEQRPRATVHDVAREAGVSLATVDRVLNGRPGVRRSTAEKVETAIATLDFRRDLSASLLARSRDLNIRFFLPDSGNEFMGNLAAAVRQRARLARAERLHLELALLPALDAGRLAEALDALSPRSCDCAVVVATDDARVARAVDAAGRRGIEVLTLVSDVPGSTRRHFVGIDNVAAGRTAAGLLGRFCPEGRIGVIAGSLDLHDHADRLAGFLDVMGAEFPALAIVGPLEGRDRDAETEAHARALLADEGLAGLYNLGAGVAGMVRALDASGRSAGVRVVAHELTAASRAALLSGAIDVVLDQNPEREIRTVLAAARALRQHGGAGLPPRPLEIGIFLRDNLR